MDCSNLLDFCYVVIAVGADCLVGSLCSCFGWCSMCCGFVDCALVWFVLFGWFGFLLGLVLGYVIVGLIVWLLVWLLVFFLLCVNSVVGYCSLFALFLIC